MDLTHSYGLLLTSTLMTQLAQEEGKKVPLKTQYPPIYQGEEAPAMSFPVNSS